LTSDDDCSNLLELLTPIFDYWTDGLENNGAIEQVGQISSLYCQRDELRAKKSTKISVENNAKKCFFNSSKRKPGR